MIVCFKFFIAKVAIKSRLPFVFSAYYYGQYYYLQDKLANAAPLSPGSPVMSGPIRIKPEKNLRLLVVAEAGFALGPKGRFACEELRPGAREED